MSELITKYRPQDFDEVVGQHHVITALKNTIDNKTAKTFLFTGPSGTGKTTLARIAAKKCGCLEDDITEIDAATNTGIDAMRDVASMGRCLPFSGSGIRAIIIDEAHSLSASAWKSLLKILEEPPTHLYWFLCTTELDKIPQTVKTRSALFTLRAVSNDDLIELVSTINELEGIGLSDAVIRLVVSSAKGCPRLALSNLALCSREQSYDDVALLLKQPSESKDISDVCALLLKDRESISWAKLITIAKPLLEKDPESVRIAIASYLSKVLSNVKSDKQAVNALRVLNCFSIPYKSTETSYALLLSFGKVLYED